MKKGLGRDGAPSGRPFPALTSHDLTNVIYQVVAGKGEGGPLGPFPLPSYYLLINYILLNQDGDGKGRRARLPFLQHKLVTRNLGELSGGKEAARRGFLPPT